MARPRRASSRLPSALLWRGAMRLWLDRYAVVNLGDTRCGPGGPLGDVALVPGVDPALEDNPAALGLDGDPRCFELGAALQRPFDLLLDLDGVDR
jgi:hypothetical protein